ncbi:uncharacterized protein LOC135345811 isoform X5 [Halichondria panicea]|uniref:uncharacterized protein LOC135345811 isoform X5 n=1 Tax=Halichondria panicea TaxID=6063 RepID=UPI00312B6EA9
MSAPAPPDTDTGGEENDQGQRLINPRLNPISKRNSIQLLIKKFSNFLEDLPLDQLTLLESAIDISEFQGILGALIHDDNEGGENVFDMIDQLKDRYTMLHGIVRGLIAKTGKSNPVSGNVPSKEPPSQITGQSSSQNGVKPKLDGAVEKILEQQLMAAMKPLPMEDLEKVQSMLAEGNDPSLILRGLQPAFPKLTDELIIFAVKYPSELKAVIEQVLFDYKLEGVTSATTTAEPPEPTQITENSNEKTDIIGSDDKGQGDEELNKPVPGEVVDEHDYQDTEDIAWAKQPYTDWMPSTTAWVPYWARQTTSWMQDTFQRRPVKTGGWFGAWHFLIIFLLIAALVGVGYICSHNKIRAYIAEVASKGRKARNYTYKQVSTT